MSDFLSTEILVIELLLVVSLVAIGVRRLRVPYTVALVIAGLLITLPQTHTMELTPELILTLFVPPLVFEAAFHLEFGQLRANLAAIVVLAVPGVLITTAVVGVVVSAGLGIGLMSGMVFGALIAATDPIAVVALFRALGAPRRLAVTIEGESLFNDGTAIVVFNLVLAAALASTTAAETVGSATILTAGVDFLRVSAVGLAIGGGLGWITSLLIARLDDYLIETTLTTVLAFGSYLLADQVQASGVLAVVAAGIVCGNIGIQGMSPTTRIVLLNFWEYLAFVVNSLVFLLIGIDVHISQLLAYATPIAIAVVGVLVSRALVVYGLAAIANIRRTRVPWAYQHVLFWGGLRGAIALALVLSLPASFADRELLRVMAFGVVLFTLLVQGTTMGRLLEWLGLVSHEATNLAYERQHGKLMALRAAHERIDHLYHNGLISPFVWEQVGGELEQRLRAVRDAQQTLLREHPGLRAAELDDVRRESLRAERAMLTTLLSNGVISDSTYADLVAAIDLALDAPASTSAPSIRTAADDDEPAANDGDEPAANDGDEPAV